MALRVDLKKETLVASLNATIASLKRSLTKQPNPLIVEIVNKDIATLQNAINTITDTK